MANAAATKSSKEKSPGGFQRTPRQAVQWSPASGREATILDLQCKAGNRAVSDWIRNNVSGSGADPGDENRDASRVTRQMERSFGISFSQIAIRTDEAAASRANMLSAKAYADGNEIGFAAGEFAPETREGLHTIAHEFAHVAQRRNSNRNNNRMIGLAGDQTQTQKLRADGDPEIVEVDADDAANAVLAGEQPRVMATEKLTIAKDSKGAKPKVPPRGSYFVSPGTGGGFVFTFNSLDVLGWKDRRLVIFAFYMKDVFPGVSDQIINQIAVERGITLTKNIADEDVRKSGFLTVSVEAKVHNDIVASMARIQPALKPKKPQLGSRNLGVGGGGGAGGSGAKKADGSGGGEGAQGQQKDPQAKGEGLPPGVAPPAEAKVPVITVTDIKQIEELKRKGLIAVDSADKIKGKLEKQEQLTFEEAVTLVEALNQVIQASKPEESKQERESWLKWAKFIEANKEKISGKSTTGDKGITVEEVKEILKKHKEFVGAKDLPAKSTKDAVYDPEKRKSWNTLSDWEKKLWDDYLKKYGQTADVTDQSIKDLHLTSDVRFNMALRMSPQYMQPGAREAAEQLFNDPIFIGTTVAGVTIYLALWLAPEPIFTKAAAVLTTIGILSLVAFSVSEIKNLAEAWMQLSADSAEARTIQELEAAAEQFGKSIGASGLRILVALATVLVGKALPTPKPLPPVSGGGGGMVAAGAGGPSVIIARPVTVPAVVVQPNGAIIIVTGPAGGMAMTGGGGGGGGGTKSTPEEAGAGEKKDVPKEEPQKKAAEGTKTEEKPSSQSPAQAKGATIVQQEVANPNVKVGSGETWTGKGGEPQWNNPKSTKAYDHIESTHGPKVKPNQFEGRMGSTGTSKSQGQWYDPNDWVAAEQLTPKQPGKYVLDFRRPIGRVYKAGGPPVENVTRAFVRRLPDGTLDTAFPVTDDYTF
jgi:Domain of unknown function (DUF4157)